MLPCTFFFSLKFQIQQLAQLIRKKMVMKIHDLLSLLVKVLYMNQIPIFVLILKSPFSLNVDWQVITTSQNWLYQIYIPFSV